MDTLDLLSTRLCEYIIFASSRVELALNVVGFMLYGSASGEGEGVTKG